MKVVSASNALLVGIYSSAVVERTVSSVMPIAAAILLIGSVHLSRQKSARSHSEASRAISRRRWRRTSFVAHSFLVVRSVDSKRHRKSIVVAETSRCAVSRAVSNLAT